MKNQRPSTSWRLSRQSALGGAIFLVILHTIFKQHSHQPKDKNITEYPKFKRLYNHDVYWELPPADKSPPLRGILIFLHGCNHQGGDLFPQSSHCPTCLGLPEEQRTRKLALHHHNLAVVAISSLQATHQGIGCWDPSQEGSPGQDDLSSVAAIIRKIVTEHEPQLKNLPIFALGVSSGGALALFLPKVMQLAGICAQIMAIYPQELENILNANAPAGVSSNINNDDSISQQQQPFSYPPTIFMHMPRDAHTASYIEKDAAVLHSHSIPVAVMQTAPRAMTPKFLTHHSDGQISHDLAIGIVGSLQHHKLLDSKGFLVKDPRQSRDEWVAAVEPVTENFISLEPNASPLSTLMNVAFAGHEIITSGLNSALNWLENGGQGDLLKWVTEEEKAEAE
jgi:poly(3-hydroxybutyrate) depolymerase